MPRRTGKEGLYTRVVKKRRKEHFPLTRAGVKPQEEWSLEDTVGCPEVCIQCPACDMCEVIMTNDKILFQTTDEQKAKLSDIIVRMVNSGLSVERIVLSGALAYWDQGMFELFEMWSEEDIRGDRSEAVITWYEIGRLLEDHRKAGK